MTGRLTPLNLSFVTLVGWALFLGVLTARPELVLVTAPLLVALVAARLGARAGSCRLTHGVSAPRVLEGDRVTVTVTLAGPAPLPLLEVLEPLPPLVDVVRGHSRALFTLRAGQEIRWSYELRCLARRRLPLGTVHLRAWDPSGLRFRELRYDQRKTIAVYPRVVPLRRLPRPRATQPFVGNYVSPALGEGIEPGEVRPFAPGDRIRQVNWRATRRHDRLYVTQRQQERNADVVLMLDTLAAVGPPGATTLDFATRAAASLATAYLARKDRVGLIEYGGMPRISRWCRRGSCRRRRWSLRSLEIVDFQRRVRDAAIGSGVILSQVRYWIAIAAAGAGLVLTLALASSAIQRLLRTTTVARRRTKSMTSPGWGPYDTRSPPTIRRSNASAATTASRAGQLA